MCCSGCLDLLVKLGPLVTTLILGAFGAWIAWRQYQLGQNQYQLARDRVRLDLFEKRRAAYDKLTEYFSAVLSEGRVKDPTMGLMYEAKGKAQFLFGEDVQQYLQELWTKSLDLRTCHLQLYDDQSPLPVGPERTAAAQKQQELLLWTMEQAKQAPEIYAKYLKFDL